MSGFRAGRLKVLVRGLFASSFVGQMIGDNTGHACRERTYNSSLKSGT